MGWNDVRVCRSSSKLLTPYIGSMWLWVWFLTVYCCEMMRLSVHTNGPQGRHSVFSAYDEDDGQLAVL